MSTFRLALRQVRYTNKAFWRNPASAFFTFAFPLMFLVIFTSLLGKNTQPYGKIDLKFSTIYVVAMGAFGVISACYTNIAMSVSFQRDSGILKRTKGTPLPAWAYLFGRIVHATFVGAILVAITMLFGRVFYQAAMPTGLPLVEFLITFLVGALSLSALALALTAVIPNADASPAIVNASILPLLFVSGVFIPLGAHPPTWIQVIGKVFPVKHFLDAMNASFLVVKTPAGLVHVFAFSSWDVAIVAAWGLLGLVLASRFFSWEPRK
jgi:ABC-2 type transport system permease protein